jgi:diguanylate cyclase (GGDEF)-like protein
VAILVVDDSPDATALVEGMLHFAGYREVTMVDSAGAALDRLGLAGGPLKDNFDVVLLDVVMPGVNGLEVCRRIKEAYPDLPVILMTACTQAADIDAAFRAGADDYLTKPLQRRELIARVGMAWRLKTESERRMELLKKLRATNEELERLSALDGLTGLANRRRFDETINVEWGRAARNQEELAVIMLDLDHFKAFNDRHGHPAGDEALRSVAAVLRSVAGRSADLVARYGGEEFVVLLPATTADGAATVAERIRAGVESLEIVLPRARAPARLTVSLGVASALPLPHSTPADLVATADRALYRAKREGRNCVRSATRHVARPTPFVRREQ